jgi:hypothetical protein
MKQCLVPVLIYNFLLKLKPMIKIWLLNLFFYKCGDNDISVATFVATLMNTLDAAALEYHTSVAVASVDAIGHLHPQDYTA